MKRKPESGGDSIGDEESQEPPMRSTSPAAKPKKKNRKNADVEDKDRRRSAGEPEDYNEDEAEERLPIVESSGDVCCALMERYARSTAPQHRHLCATAAAMRSILSEEGLPLTPPAYFAAAITAFQDADRSDREGVAALSAFLAVVLQHVTSESLPKAKAKDAAFVIASFIRDSADCLSTGTLRSMVKSLGQVALMVDLEDWPSIELAFHTLLLFAVDKRPKVRRSAQSGLEILFKYCHDSSIVKKASKVVYRMHRKYITTIKILSSIELTDATLNNSLSKPEHLEAIHVLNVLNAILPYLSDKVRIEILSDTHKLLSCHFSWPTRHILRILEVLLEHFDIKALVAQAENIVSAVTSYIATAEKNPVDTIVSASILLKNLLKKLGDELPSMWTRYLPIAFTSLIGYLGSDSDASKNVADILKEFINFHIKQSFFRSDKGQLRRYEMDSCPEAAAVTSICKVLDKMLKKCSFSTELMLEVISVLFLKLGGSSFFFMKKTLIILSKFAQNEDSKSNIPHIEQCVGTAVIAMGPEKLLSLIPITFDIKKLTLSNSWIIPILKKYVVGASLQYFMDNIVPLAKCIQEAYKNDNKEFIQKSLLSYFSSLWDLLPAFCRYPTDISEKFESLSMLLVVVLKEEPSLHESIALALQILVHSNREYSRHCVDDPSSIFSQKFNMEFIRFCYSKKVACKNMKALASRSVELFQILKEIFFEYPDRRGCIKDALGSLGFIIPSEYIKSFFLSTFKTIEQSNSLIKSESIHDHAQLENKKDGEAKAGFEKNEQSCLLMELASSFVEAADTDLTHIIFDFIKSSLLNTNAVFQSEAYFTLNRILKEKDSYSCAQLDVLIELLFTVKPPIDASTLKTRFSCFDHLLVYMLKSNVADMNIKAFFILNEIILTLKSKKESRKLAYDSLLNISIKLKTLQSDCTDSNILHLFTMVMGYLSSSSPHIMSGAVSALSLLIYHDATFCLSVPNLIPSVLVLLQNKSNEVIKAALGFIKVLVSSLKCNDLRKLLPEILQGVLPWSLVSKHHFRSKVGIILEILIRKCGSESVECQTTDKYKGFVKSIKEGRVNRKLAKGANDSESTDLIADRGKKRQRDDEKFSKFKSERRSKFKSKDERIGKKPDKSFSSNQNYARTTKKGLRNRASNQRRKYAKKQGSGVDSSRTNRPEADKSRFNNCSRRKI